MKRALALFVLLLATAANSADVTLTTRLARESSSQKPQWAPSGNFSALHTRSVFEGETRSGAGSYARENRKTAAAKTVWSYANPNPARYTDPDGREGIYDLAQGCAWGIRTDLGFSPPLGMESGPCGSLERCQFPKQPDDADARRGFNQCRPSEVFGPVSEGIRESDTGTTAREWWYAGGTRQQIIGGVFGSVAGATGTPLPSALPPEAPVSSARRVVHEGHQPRPLQEKATSPDSAHASHLTSTKPQRTSPQVRKRATSCFTRRGTSEDTAGQPRRKASCSTDCSGACRRPSPPPSTTLLYRQAQTFPRAPGESIRGIASSPCG